MRARNGVTGMNINPASVYSAYKAGGVKAAEATAASARVEATPKGTAANTNTDTVSLSSKAAQRLEAKQIASSIANQIEPPSDPARVEEIRKAVENNTYFVPTDRLATAILSRWASL